MADGHPYAAHRDHKVRKARVPHIAGSSAGGLSDDTAISKVTNGYATGGAVVAQRDSQAVTGKPARQRLDRPTNRARGGRTGKSAKATHVNVIVGSHPPAPSAPGVAAAGVPPAVAPPVAARPPLPVPPPGLAPPGVGGPPPGMLPPRKHGGRNYAKGGGVFAAGKRAGTQVQNSGTNKLDGKNVGRGKVVTYKTGGPVEHPQKGGMAPHLPGGGKGGLARLAKARRAARG